MTCKKTHQEIKAATGDAGVTLFICCWPGTAEGRPAPRSAAGRGGSAAGAGGSRGPGAGRCAEPLTLPGPCAHTLGRCVFKQRKVAQPKPPLPPPPLRWLSGGRRDIPSPHTVTGSSPALAAPRRTDALSLLHCSLRP